MPTAWPYPPQETLPEYVGFEGITRTALADGTCLAQQITTRGQRRFRLQYSAISSSDCAGMQAFFADRGGGHEAFDFVSPLDARMYRVRLDSAVQIVHLAPVWFATGGELVFRVVDP